MAAGTYHTQHRTVVKADVSDRDWAVRAVLSLPVPDLANDVVRPEGLNFAPHAADPWVDLEHGFEPGVGRRPVGWARKSLAAAGGPYSVEWAALDVPGVGRCRLPVGTSYFDRDDPLSRQVYLLVRKGALPGVSLEFRPVRGFARSRGPSPLERRDAYEFERADVVRWTHCVDPVCPGALTVLKSLPAELDPLARVLRDGTVEGEALHPVVLKSLARYKPAARLVAAPAPPAPTTVKAMPDATATQETVYDAAAPDVTGAADDAGTEAPAKPTAAAHYNFADGLLRLIDQAENDLEASEHLKGKRFLLGKLEKLRAECEAIKGMGDRIDAETADADESAGPDGDDPGSEPDMSTDDDGTFKAVRRPYRAILKAVKGVRRYSLAEVQKGIAEARAAAAEDGRVETPAEALARLKVENPAEYERLSKKALRLRRLASA